MKEELPLISIIVPVYNVESYVGKCLDSLKVQTYTNLEIIAVDDASTDKSGSICDACAAEDKRLQIVHFPSNRGLSAARNEGISRAKGELAAFVDSDDYAEPDMILKLYRSLRESGADISVCSNIGMNMKEAPAGVYSAAEAVYCMARRGPFLWTVWGKLYPAELIKKHAFHEKAFCCEDLLFFYEILKEIKQVSYIPDKLYNYVYREGSQINSRVGKKRCTVLSAINRICKDAGVNFPETVPGFLQIALDTNVRLAMEAVEKGTKEGNIGSYLHLFQKHIRRHFTWSALFVNPDVKTMTAVLTLYVSRRTFFCFASVYSSMKSIGTKRRKTE